MATVSRSGTPGGDEADLLRLASTPAMMITMPVPNHMICMITSTDCVLNRTKFRSAWSEANVPILRAFGFTARRCLVRTVRFSTVRVYSLVYEPHQH